MNSMIKTAVAISLSLAVGTLMAAEHKLSADVVVVGAGSAGLSASVQAAENGAKVILLEKNNRVGGSTAFAEGLFGVESDWQRLNADILTKEGVFKDMMERLFYMIDANKTKDFIDGSAENLEWLAKHGIKFEHIKESVMKEPTWHVISDYKGTNHGAGLINALKDSADKLGVQTMLATPATELITNKEGDVVGIKAKDGKGDTYVISTQNVILASGGFGDDPQKVKEWGHKDPTGLKSSVPVNKTGDGIQMALNVGAQQGEATFITHPGTEGKGINFLGNLYTASWQPAALWVNSDGNRFVPEDITLSFTKAGNAIYSQYGHYAWSIFDESQVKYMAEKGIDSGIGVLIPIGTKLTNLQKEIDEALKANSESFKSANSVAQLAKEINVPEKNLQEAIDQYNKYCEQKHDGQFFKHPAFMRPLNTNHLYALKLGAYYFSSYGGLRTNRNHQVLNKENKPIKGLYATGLEVSDMVGPSYTTWDSGHAFGFASYSGRHAAINATKDMKK